MKPAEIYILNKPEPLKSILLHLQVLIEKAFPRVVLKFKWKIPFYYLDNKPLCYLNASKKGYVDVAFYLSTDLDKYNEFLISEKRKVVKSIRYYTLEQINNEVLIYILIEAYKIKQQLQ